MGKKHPTLQLKVLDLQKSRLFYEKLAAALGYSISSGDSDQFFIDDLCVSQGHSHGPAHFAFHARHPLNVRHFHETAVKMGGKSHWGPVKAGEDSPVSACISDYDGNKIEAIFHESAIR